MDYDDRVYQCIPSSRRLKPLYQRVSVPFEGASLTQAEFKDQCDINHQIALFTRAGRPLPAVYGAVEMDAVQDLNATYIDAINAVQEVDDAFSRLPSALRSRFHNSPLELARFLANPANRAEAYEFGLVTTPPPSPSPVESSKAPVAPSVPSDEGTPS